jgi:hypothetical protein
MTDRPIILALDLATTSGFARGRVGETPIAGSIRFGRAEASNNAVFGKCLKWIAQELEPAPRPNIVIIESMLAPQAKLGFTSRDVRDRLAGLHGIVRAVAHLRGIYDVNEAGVGQVRAHFIGYSNLKRDHAKSLVMERCRQLGWHAEDDNAGDALALWSYAAALIDPELAMRLSPLFNRNLRAAS